LSSKRRIALRTIKTHEGVYDLSLTGVFPG
jgi:hypothetical protein